MDRLGSLQPTFCPHAITWLLPSVSLLQKTFAPPEEQAESPPGRTPCSSGFINNWDFCWFASTREGQRAARGDSKQQHPRQGAEGQARRARVAVPGHPASPGGRKAPRATPRAEGATRASRCLDLLTAQAKLPDLLSACAETGGKVAACWGAGWSTSGAWRNP